MSDLRDIYRVVSWIDVRLNTCHAIHCVVLVHGQNLFESFTVKARHEITCMQTTTCGTRTCSALGGLSLHKPSLESPRDPIVYGPIYFVFQHHTNSCCHDASELSMPSPATVSPPFLPPAPDRYTTFTPNEKHLLTFLLGLATITSPLTATIYFPLLPLLRVHFNTSAQAINLTITIYIIFQALSHQSSAHFPTLLAVGQCIFSP